MKPFEPRDLLCGIDFSPASLTALAYTALIAKAYAAQAHILHAHHIDLPPYMGSSQWDALRKELKSARGAAEDHMREFAAPVLRAAGVTADIYAVDAAPVDALLDALDHLEPGLVVLGSHRHTGLDRFLLGSVSAGVLRETRTPLLVTRPREGAEAGEAKVEHILCPVNYTPAATAGLQAAASLAGRLGAKLTLLTALENGGDEDRERDRLCQWVPEQVKRDCDWEAAPVVKGPAAERIVLAASDLGADMIVLGGRRRAFLAASILGATTERVVNHARCPVLTVVVS